MEQAQANTPEFIKKLHNHAEEISHLKFTYPQETPLKIQEVTHFLVTGTTGFLGAFILGELLKSQEKAEKIYCLVRANSQEHAQQRIISNLKHYQLHPELSSEQLLKIVPIVGDISKDNLGLEKNIYQEISEKVQFVYHCAAAVDFVNNFDKLKPATVDGTQNILKFCASKVFSKYLYFVSTNGILAQKTVTTFFENKDIDQYLPYLVNDGYGQTKWVSEKMMWICEENGLKVSAFRFGNIGHVTTTGAKNPIDFQAQLIQTCQKIDSCPNNSDWYLEATPVDFIASAMVKLAQNPENYGKVYNIVENKPVESLKVFKNLQNKGLVKNVEDFETWMKKLDAQCMEKDCPQYCSDIQNSIQDLIKYLTDTNGYDRREIESDLSNIGVEYGRVGPEYYEIILTKQ